MLRYYLGDIHVLDEESYLFKMDLKEGFQVPRILQEAEQPAN